MSRDMKLIMERFRKNLSEMPVGAGMPLNIGAATVAGKMEKDRMAAAVENAKFIKKLEKLGNKPQFIEIEPGDIKGDTYEYLSNELNNGAKRMKLGYFFFLDAHRGGPANSIIPFNSPDKDPYKGSDGKGIPRPARVSPAEVAELLKIVLGKMGLWTKIKLSQDQEEELRKDVDKLSKDRM